MTDDMDETAPLVRVSERLGAARAEAKTILAKLTERQVTVLEMAAQLRTNDEIAFEIGKHRRTVEEHLVAARKKLNAKTRGDAIRKYIVLLEICGRPTCGFVRVDLTTEDIENLLSDLSFESAVDLMTSPEFEDFKRRFDSKGPEAWTARFGPQWKIFAAIALAVLLMGAFASALLIGHMT